MRVLIFSLFIVYGLAFKSYPVSKGSVRSQRSALSVQKPELILSLRGNVDKAENALRLVIKSILERVQRLFALSTGREAATPAQVAPRSMAYEDLFPEDLYTMEEAATSSSPADTLARDREYIEKRLQDLAELEETYATPIPLPEGQKLRSLSEVFKITNPSTSIHRSSSLTEEDLLIDAASAEMSASTLEEASAISSAAVYLPSVSTSVPLTVPTPVKKSEAVIPSSKFENLYVVEEISEVEEELAAAFTALHSTSLSGAASVSTSVAVAPTKSYWPPRCVSSSSTGQSSVYGANGQMVQDLNEVFKMTTPSASIIAKEDTIEETTGYTFTSAFDSKDEEVMNVSPVMVAVAPLKSYWPPRSAAQSQQQVDLNRVFKITRPSDITEEYPVFESHFVDARVVEEEEEEYIEQQMSENHYSASESQKKYWPPLSTSKYRLSVLAASASPAIPEAGSRRSYRAATTTHVDDSASSEDTTFYMPPRLEDEGSDVEAVITVAAAASAHVKSYWPMRSVTANSQGQQQQRDLNQVFKIVRPLDAVSNSYTSSDPVFQTEADGAMSGDDRKYWPPMRTAKYSLDANPETSLYIPPYTADEGIRMEATPVIAMHKSYWPPKRASIQRGSSA